MSFCQAQEKVAGEMGRKGGEVNEGAAGGLSRYVYLMGGFWARGSGKRW